MSSAPDADSPVWLSDRGVINEVGFCEDFVRLYPIKYINNQFLTVDGVISEEKVAYHISNMLMPYVRTNIARKVKSICGTLKLYCYNEKLPFAPDEIHVKNGILKTSGRFITHKEFCMNRLNVQYIPNNGTPEIFLHFLHDMLDDDDISTLQEYLGYCMIPSTKGQAMLFIIGNGGEGKSRIGVVMKEIFGNSMIPQRL
ncbi:MAG: hypothetical protein ACI38A_07535 [Candidatus Ornithomonoglobus sp.]